jgi:hypothetical protein
MCVSAIAAIRTSGVWASMADRTKFRPSVPAKAVRPAGVEHSVARLLRALSTMAALAAWLDMEDCRGDSGG